MREIKAGQKLYYNNNRCYVVSVYGEEKKMALIALPISPHIDVDVSGTCMACCCGDSDNKLQCTCEETEWLLERIEESLGDTHIPLIVTCASLHEKPLVVETHEADLKRLDGLKDDAISKRKEAQKDKNRFLAELREWQSDKDNLLKEIEATKEELEGLREKNTELRGDLKSVEAKIEDNFKILTKSKPKEKPLEVSITHFENEYGTTEHQEVFIAGKKTFSVGNIESLKEGRIGQQLFSAGDYIEAVKLGQSLAENELNVIEKTADNKD